MQNNYFGSIAVAFSVFFLCGCAASLSSQQKQQLAAYESSGQLVKEKNPTTGVILGFLPGGGSFYTRRYGIGALNLISRP